MVGHTSRRSGRDHLSRRRDTVGCSALTTFPPWCGMPKARADGPEICCTLLRRAASADVIRRSLKAAQQQITLAQCETCEPWPRPDERAVAATTA